MLTRRSSLVLVTLCFCWGGSAAAQRIEGVALPTRSIAEPDGAQSVLESGAGLTTLRAFELRVINSQAQKAGGEGTALLYATPVWGGLSIGAGAEFMRPKERPASQRLSLGVGYRFHHALRLGVVWRHWFSDDDGALDGTDSVDLHALLRPVGWLSVGLGVRNLNTPRVGALLAERRYEVGLAFQPGTDRLAIEAGVEIGERTTDLAVSGRLRLTPIRGWDVTAQTRAVLPDAARGEVAWELGVSTAFHFGMGGVLGGAYLRGTGLQDIGWTVGARVSGASYGPLWRRHGKTILIELGGLSEAPKPGLVGNGVTFTHLALWLDRLRRDETVAGVLIRDQRARWGWAQAEELRDLLQAFRDDGKQVNVYLDQGDLRSLYVYSVANRIYLNPAGGLMLTGLRSTVSYYKDALDKLHIATQWVRYGKYKSAVESFRRTGPSKEALEVKNSLLDGLYDTLLDGIAAGREIPREQLPGIVDDGPYVAPEALERKLVDKLVFWDEVQTTLRKELGSLVVVRRAAPRFVAPEPWDQRPLIAVIPVEGTIVDGKSSKTPLLNTKNVGHKTIIAAVKAAMANPRVKGLVLRVNSPGGSSTASDHMHRALQVASKKKPIVTSMGDVAASGGYYIAMGTREVVAGDMTITGSIGIFTGKPAFGALYNLLGIGRSTVTRGRRAALFATDKPWTDEELALMAKKLRHFYDLFLKRVADNRKMTPKAVDALAQGRVWLGNQARARKLVDTRGGVVTAVRRVRELAGMDLDAPFGVVFYPRPTLTERIRNTLGVQIEALLSQAGHLREALVVAYPFLNGLRPGEPLALMPFHVSFD